MSQSKNENRVQLLNFVTMWTHCTQSTMNILNWEQRMQRNGIQFGKCPNSQILLKFCKIAGYSLFLQHYKSWLSALGVADISLFSFFTYLCRIRCISFSINYTKMIHNWMQRAMRRTVKRRMNFTTEKKWKTKNKKRRRRGRRRRENIEKKNETERN